jgi:AcrR family transcriptional regulator
MEAKATRNPEHTRAKLLDAAFQEMYAHGFQAASLERILAGTDVTKGALYHHFPNKRALGLAVIDEVIQRHIHESGIAPLEHTDDPLTLLHAQLTNEAATRTPEELAQGCPLNNLVQEMAPLDVEFRERLNGIWLGWRKALADALRRGQAAGHVRADADPDEVAVFVTAAMEGAQGMAKAAASEDALRGCYRQLAQYLLSLAPPR